MILPDWFIWWNFTRVQSGVWRTVLLCLPTVLMLATLLLSVVQVRFSILMHWAFLLFICIAVPKLVFVITDLIGRGLVWRYTEWLPVVHRVAVVCSVAMAALQIYGATWGWRRLVVESHALKIDKLPAAFDGYKVVQISDLHLGTYVGETDFVEEVVDSVNRLHPDMIVFTGDLVNNTSEEAVPYIKILKRLKAKDGVYSILGNHDYCMLHTGLSPAAQRREVQRLIRAEEAMGWNVLLNENRPIVRGDDTLYVAGVENIGRPPFPEFGKLSPALEGIPSGACTVLLSHDPWHWRNGVVGSSPVSLTLSGHTHALQMQIGRFSPAAWFIPEWGGLYKEGNQLLYVSTGIGGRVPYRLGAWPKIELLTLRK